MANQDRVNFVWAESALTTIPPIPVSEVAYRDTAQTPEQMEVGQQYDTIYNSARHNQLLFLLTSVAKTLCENGIMPFLAGQAYDQYARCIFTDGKIYSASRAIAANESPYPTPGDDSFVWIKEGGGGTPAGSVLPFYNVNLGGPDNRNPIFWGESEPDTGWLICDGGSDGQGGSVPDLRGKFIMCSSYSGDAGQTGGAASVTPTVSVQNATQGGSIGNTTAGGGIAVSGTGVSVQGTTLDGNMLPSHNHSMLPCIGASDQGVQNFLRSESTSAAWVSATNYAGNSSAHAHGIHDTGHSHGFSGTAHTHTFTGAAHTHTAKANTINTLPPYYKMAYCVKLPE